MRGSQTVERRGVKDGLFRLSRVVRYRPGSRRNNSVCGLVLVSVVVLNGIRVRAQAAGSPKGGGASPAGQSSTGAGGGSGGGAGGASGSGATGGSGGGASGLQGISFARDFWKSDLQRVPTPTELGIRNAKIVALCYKLVPGKSAAQPFILQSPPASTIAQWQPNKEYKKGDLVVPSPHGQTLTGTNSHYYRAMSTGWSGNDSRVFGATDAKPSKDGTIPWKDMGNLVWQKDHAYKEGALIAPNGDGKNFFQARHKGTSGDSAPAFSGGQEVTDNGRLVWRDVGLAGVSAFPGVCSNVNPSEPLLMNQVIAVAIDMSAIPANTQDRFKILNLNLTNQQGAPLNPTPIRPGLAASTATGSAVASTPVDFSESKVSSEIYYLTWPNQLPGDTIPTVGINLIYTPVASALPWNAGTFYPAGSVVISKVGRGTTGTTNGHYYLALNSGVSSDSPPNFDAAAVPVPTFTDGPGVGWKDLGPTPVLWAASTSFTRGALMIPNPPNGDYYRARMVDTSKISGKTGPNPPVFPTQKDSSVQDGEIEWIDKGPTPTTASWQSGHLFTRGWLVTPVPPNGHYYEAQTNGTTGPNPPGFSKDGTVVADGPGLAWQDAGATTTPPVWKAAHAYAQGAPVTPDPPNGRYYQAQAADGKSGTSNAKKAPAFPVDLSTIPDTASLSWKDLGPAPVYPAWQANTAVASGAVVIPTPANGHFYRAQTDGVTGQNQPPFRIGATVTEASNLVWIDVGPALPTTAKNLKTWAPATPFFVGDVIQGGLSGHYYSVVQAGISGSTSPEFYVPAPEKISDGSSGNETRWQDLGSSLPASVSALGTTPSDQPINLLTYTLPQVHTLSYFNLTSGIVVSSIKTASFTNTGTPTAPTWISTTNSITFDPILALTAYFKPIDAERPWQRSDLIPGMSIAFSLSSPTTNFYFGGSSEFPKLRNVQLIYGLSLFRTSTLEPPYTSNTAVTKQSFSAGGFAGVTFNILGFIQTLF
jgi:hypothetical protein